MQWFQFNPTATTSLDPYSTGPQRAWYPPITVPVILGEYQRAAKNFDDDGMYLVDRVHGIISDWQFFTSTIPDPDPNGVNHLNDRVAFDGRLFGVTSFIPRGRVASYFLTISFDLVEITAEDLAEDTAIAQFAPYINAS